MNAPHMNEEMLAMFAEGKLTTQEAQEVADHVAECTPCLRVVGAVNETLREERQDVSSSTWRRLAVAAALAVIVAGAAVFAVRLRSASPVARLVALSPKTMRPVEPRLTGGFAWAPYRGADRALDPAASTQQLKLGGAAGELIEKAQEDRSVTAQHAAAEAMVLTGDPQDAAKRLRVLAAQAPSNADVWSDLAAAEAAAALRSGRASLYPQALAAAERALQQNPNHREALFNRALIAERMGLAGEARAAWQHYLAADPSSAWATEARDHLARLGHSGSSRFERELPRMENGDDAALRQVVAAYPQQSRTYAEGQSLAQWGDAFARGDMAGAERSLSLARRIGNALAAQSGESLLRDAVASIDRADPETKAVLARAHATYRRGRITYSHHEPAAAEGDLRAAARDFAAGGSPMSLVARYFAANARFDQNDVRGARAELQPLLQALDQRYVALRAQVRWELALCDNADADWNGAFASLTGAAEDFRRLGERSNAAFVDLLIAQALGGLGRPDEAWEARIRSFAGLADNGERLAVGLTSAVHNELRAGRADAASALLRASVDAARRSPDQALFTGALLSQALLGVNTGDAGAAHAAVAEMSAVVDRMRDPALREKAATMLRVARAAVLLASQPREAETLLTEAIAFYGRSGKPLLLAEPYLLRARARIRGGDTIGATADLDAGIGIVESQRVELARGVVGTGVLDAGRALFQEAIRVSVDRNDAAAAFAYAERSRDEIRPDLRELQRRLAGTHTVVLESNAVGDEIIELVIGAGTIHALRHPRGDDLYEVLIRPAEPFIGDADHLIIVPDASFGGVSFAALRDRTTSTYLVERYSVAVAKSASSLEPAPGGAPRSAVAMMLPSGGATGTVALPEASNELADVCSAYAACTKEQPDDWNALQSAARSGDVVHLAGHTAGVGGETALVFGAERISWRAIAAMPLQRDATVVLAACDTLEARDDSNERAPSLGAAFAAAGAGDVVGTLTPIADVTARSLFRSIHRELAAGSSATDAVRQTQINAIAAHDGDGWQSIEVLTRHIPKRRTTWAN